MRKRNHPLFVIKHIILSTKQLIIPFALLLIANLKRTTPLIIILGAVVVLAILLIVSFLKWRTSTYGIENETLIIEKGVLGRSRQAIALDKITTINENQEILERIFNLTVFKVDAGTATKGNEVKLTISHKEAEILREQLTGKKAILQQTQEEGKTDQPFSYRIGYIELLKYAVANANLLFGVVIVSALVNFINAVPIIGDNLDQFFSNWTGQVEGLDPQHLPIQTMITLIIIVIIIYIILTLIISTIITFTKYYGFTLSKKGNELHIEYGLIEKKSFTISSNKITALYINYSFLGKFMGLCSLMIENIGYGDEKGEAAILFPIIHGKKKDELIRNIMPEFLFQETEVIKPNKKARLSYLIRYASVPFIAAIVLCIVFPFGFIALFAPIIFGVCAIVAYKKSGVQLDKNKVVFINGILGRRYTIVKNNYLQSFRLVQNPFQKRIGMANISYTYQSNTFGKTIGIKGVEKKLFEKAGLYPLGYQVR